MKYYSPTGRRNHGRPLKRLLDTWDRNGSTSGPIPWKIYDDDDDDDDDDKKRRWVTIRIIRRSSVVVTKRILEFHINTAVLCHGLHNFIMSWMGRGWGDGQINTIQASSCYMDTTWFHYPHKLRLSPFYVNGHAGHWTVQTLNSTRLIHADYHRDMGAFCCSGGKYNLKYVLHDTYWFTLTTVG